MMKHLYLLRAFLFVLISVFILLLLQMSIFDILNHVINLYFLCAVFLILVFWLLSIHSFYKFISLLNEEKMAREVDRLQLEESKKLIQILRSQRHDFRNQLQVIKIMAQFQRNQEIIDYIQDCNTALEFSKEIPTQIDNAAIFAMTIFFATQAREHGIEFSVDSDIDFNDFKLSPAKTTRLLGNIIQNAIEIFKGNDRQERNIQLTMWEESDNYHFIVWNNGPSIPADEQELIFQAGYTTKNSTGLGLAIVKQLVEEMGGRISLVSNEKEGTEFRIIISKKNQQPYYSFSEHVLNESHN
ncbi:MAG: GHKL domain-containing protein [Firmicutes bacterium]|nr:GHKL domain-containing protein [Bacillota bacterium]